MKKVLASVALLVLGCGGDSSPAGDGGGPDASSSSDVAADAPLGSCDPFGHFGVPTSTFTLPATAGQTISYNDVQKSFPNVDWSKLDRLYVPAGHYPQFLLGNLPTRDPNHPLVITNLGGQVVIGPSPSGNYLWSMTGGAGWVLSGRYDPDSKTGDAAFPGHRCGAYAGSPGHYGFLSDDQYALQAPYLHMGIAVGSATKFEIEFVEVERSGFAGIRLLNSRAQNDPATPMEDVKVHDTYVHDTDGEGFYFGWTGAPPSNLLPNIQIYNNRILRTGNEALQIQDLGEGSHVHHNAMISGGLHWLDNGLGRYQDNNSQILIRGGHVEIDHNLFIDGAGSLLNYFNTPEPGDPPEVVTFHDDYFANTLDLGPYVGGVSSAGSTITFQNESLRGIVWGYDIISTQQATTVFGVDNALLGSLLLTQNRWEGTRALAPNASTITQNGNTNVAVTELELVDAGWPLVAGHHLTAWTMTATVPQPSVSPVPYHAGDVVRYGANPDFYTCTADTTAGPPDAHPEAWTKLPAPHDDVRAKTVAYAGYGVY